MVPGCGKRPPRMRSSAAQGRRRNSACAHPELVEGERSHFDRLNVSALEGQGLSGDWPLWEVFVRSKGGLAHRHVGSIHAPDAELALAHARDTYTRRMEGVSLWVVPSAEIVASDPDQAGELFEPAESKIYRHPTFYDIPDEVKHI